MARLRSLQPGNQNVKVHPSEVDGFHQLAIGDDGRPFLHLTTFGSDSRKSQPKSSQSLQLDEGMARQLVALLRETFPGLD